MTESDTIKELLLQAVEAEPYASSNNDIESIENSTIYSLPGLDDYLLKLDHISVEEFKKRLEETSSLYPVHLCGRNFGQALLRGDGFEIISKVSGTSLDARFIDKYKSYLTKAGISEDDSSNRDLIIRKKEKAATSILKTLNKLPVESFVKLFENINYLTDKGIAADIHWGNILLDGKVLNLVDIHAHNKTSLESYNSFEAVADFGLFSELSINEEHPLFDQLQAKLLAAQVVAKMPETGEDVGRRIQNIQFKGVKKIRTEMGNNIPLDKTPLDLRLFLKSVEKYNSRFA